MGDGRCGHITKLILSDAISPNAPKRIWKSTTSKTRTVSMGQPNHAKPPWASEAAKRSIAKGIFFFYGWVVGAFRGRRAASSKSSDRLYVYRNRCALQRDKSLRFTTCFIQSGEISVHVPVGLDRLQSCVQNRSCFGIIGPLNTVVHPLAIAPGLDNSRTS
jgi:hypothetical protein